MPVSSLLGSPGSPGPAQSVKIAIDTQDSEGNVHIRSYISDKFSKKIEEALCFLSRFFSGFFPSNITSLKAIKVNSIPYNLEEKMQVALLHLAEDTFNINRHFFLINYFSHNDVGIFADKIQDMVLTKDIVENIPDSTLAKLSECRELQASLKKAWKGDVIALYQKICIKNPGALNYLPGKFKTEELYKIVCEKSGRALQYVPESFRSSELCKIACEQHGWLLRYVPENIRVEALCKIACEQDGRALKDVPKKFIDKALCKIACKQNGSVLECVPEDLRDEALCKIACEENGRALEFVPKKFIDEALCKIACKQNGSALECAPEGLIDEALCKIACEENGRALEFVPKKFIDEALCKIACEENGWALKYVPEKLIDKALCKIACKQNGSVLKCAPEGLIDEALCKIACEENGRALECVPENLRDEALCKIACEQNGSALEFVPSGLHAPAFYNKLSSLDLSYLNLVPGDMQLEVFIKNWPLARTRLEQKDVMKFILSELSEKDPGMLNRVLLLDKNMQLIFLTDSRISIDKKKQVIEFINKPEMLSSLILVPPEHLYCKDNPMKWSQYNPFLRELLHKCYGAYGFQPPEMQAGKRLSAFIDQAEYSFAEESDLIDLLSTGTLEITGGRTLKVKVDTQPGEKYYFFKFQRQDELPETLAREGLVYQFLNKDPVGGKMKSALPVCEGFIRLPVGKLPEEIKKFSDKLEVTKENGSEFINVFCYSAPEDYSTYAWEEDKNHPHNRFMRPEAGILKACHDIGLLTGIGFIPTSTLPAFHDTGTNRRWFFMAPLTDQNYFIAFNSPGTFGAWNTDATEKPDFGNTGVRDGGDCEFYGEIKIFLQIEGVANNLYPEPVVQRIAMANAICENLLAAVLLRSRLNQSSVYYHYQNPEAIKATKKFISDCFYEFIQGYNNESLKPHNVMGIGEEDYEKWLTRAAEETVYWTAAQPDPNQPAIPAFAVGSSVYDHTECYAIHVQHGCLDRELYPDNDVYNKSYPTDFINIQNKLNLGANNCLFPLISLARGCIKLCTGIYAIKRHRAVSSENFYE